jgi:hypothetical protein
MEMIKKIKEYFKRILTSEEEMNKLKEKVKIKMETILKLIYLIIFINLFIKLQNKYEKKVEYKNEMYISKRDGIEYEEFEFNKKSPFYKRNMEKLNEIYIEKDGHYINDEGFPTFPNYIINEKIKENEKRNFIQFLKFN